MEFQNPWQTLIGKEHVDDIPYIQKLLNEVMQHPKVLDNMKAGALRIDHKEFPLIADYLESFQRQHVEKYIVEVTGMHPRAMTWSAWIHICIHGMGLVPHYHDDPVTTCLYLTHSKANLVLRDTRAAIARQWPLRMREKAHADHVIHPEVGDLYIFPGYIDHYVMAQEPDFRISLAADWSFK